MRPRQSAAESGDPIYRPFFQELRRLGYVEGQNLVWNDTPARDA
jgi:hypothetical protein